MSFTPAEERSMIARAHDAIAARDRSRARRYQVGTAAALMIATVTAGALWWQRTPTESTATPIPKLPTEVAFKAPSWLEYIHTDEEIEEGFAAAGECARVIHVDHKVLTVSCSSLTPLDLNLGQ